MVNNMSLKYTKLPSMIFIILVFFIASGIGTAASKDIQYSETYYNELGLSAFNKGFYDLLPRGEKGAADLCFEQAVTFFEKAIEIDGDFTEAHRNLARVYFIRKEYTLAVEEYKKVIALDPGDPDARLAIASAYVKLGMNDEAIEQLTAAKNQSDDPAVIEKLDRLIEGIHDTN